MEPNGIYLYDQYLGQKIVGYETETSTCLICGKVRNIAIAVFDTGIKVMDDYEHTEEMHVHDISEGTPLFG